MVIREFELEDLCEVTRLGKMLARETGVNIYAIQTALERILSGQDVCFVACDNDRIVGIISGFADYNVGFGDMFYVLPQHRHSTVGGRLMQRLVQMCKDLNLDTLTLDCMEQSIKMYEKLGFRVFSYNMIKEIK